MVARLAFVAVLVSMTLTGCASSQTSECTDNLSSHTDAENQAMAQLGGADYSGAFDSFAKAAQSRTQCVYATSGRIQGVNAGYAAFDTAGEAAAARHLGMTEDAAKLMGSAKDLAAEVVKYHGIPSGMMRAMRKLAATSE